MSIKGGLYCDNMTNKGAYISSWLAVFLLEVPQKVAPREPFPNSKGQTRKGPVPGGCL